MNKKKRPPAPCHPDRLHCAKGLCKQCYDQKFQNDHKESVNARKRKWSAENPERRLAHKRKYLYGVTAKQVEELLKKQGGVCAICKTPSDKKLHVDHDHVTNEVRGILCGNCNRGVGLFKDSQMLLRKAAAYLTPRDPSYEDAVEKWKSKVGGWIGFDLDATLAEYRGWAGPTHIGPPVEKTLTKVRELISRGIEVRIFTARASDQDPNVRLAIESWCQAHVGKILPVTNVKDYSMIALYDDRAIQVVPNTGERIDGED